jgi:hypothetical protein
MMKKLIKMVVAGSMLTFGSAHAAVLTFDDLPSLVSVSNGYGGFNWTASGGGIYSIDKNELPDTGYEHGTVSGNNSVFNGWGISGNSIDLVGAGTFEFNGAHFTSAWNNQNLSFEGWNDGVLVYASDNFAINTEIPLFVSLNWLGIDRLVINNDPNGNMHWVMDNFTFNENVAQTPVPAAVWLFGSALAGLVGMGKRKKA